jgi:hypothetical protein
VQILKSNSATDRFLEGGQLALVCADGDDKINPEDLCNSSDDEDDYNDDREEDEDAETREGISEDEEEEEEGEEDEDGEENEDVDVESDWDEDDESEDDWEVAADGEEDESDEGDDEDGEVERAPFDTEKEAKRADKLLHRLAEAEPLEGDMGLKEIQEVLDDQRPRQYEWRTDEEAAHPAIQLQFCISIENTGAEMMVFQAGTVADLAHRDLMANESVRIAGLENVHALDFSSDPFLPRVVYNEDGFTSVASPPGAPATGVNFMFCTAWSITGEVYEPRQ